ncbi:MAG: hypothetical protein K2O42_03140, partial [Oscillospiraceae bacterium]|nr:hypothetical protein [Oscillospiraceae bacterium]
MSKEESLHFSTAPDEKDAEVREILESIPESASGNSDIDSDVYPDNYDALNFQEESYWNNNNMQDDVQDDPTTTAIPDSDPDLDLYSQESETGSNSDLVYAEMQEQPESVEKSENFENSGINSNENPINQTKVNQTKNKMNQNKKRKKKKSRGRKFPSLFPEQGDSFGEALRKMVFLVSSTVFVVCLFMIGQ